MTAEEFMTQEQYYGVTSGDEFEIQKIMKDFAQYHVEKTLKAASESIEQEKLDWYDKYDYSCGVQTVPNTDNIEAILESYDLNKIK